MSWSREEVEATVADYLHMLTQELAGQTYSKTAHRRALQPKLGGRSDGAIERKHQNISAVLLELGCPWIVGYKPLGNYQQLLFDVVLARVHGDNRFEQVASSAAQQPATVPLVPDLSRILESAPEYHPIASEPIAPYLAPRQGVKRDYLALEARNASLGLAGEELVVAFERERLRALGAKRLADRVEHAAVDRGDGLGFDVLSFEEDGRERFIEVKTTAFARETPFFVTRNELDFSRTFAPQFRLYRLFQFRRDPRMFVLEGAVDERCHLNPVSYRAEFR